MRPRPDVRILNRVLRWTFEGIEYEPDQRHAEHVIQRMGLETGKPSGVTGVATDNLKDDEREKHPVLRGTEATEYRALAKKMNYPALDRVELQYAAKGISKDIASPRSCDWTLLKKVAKYLVGPQGSCSSSSGSPDRVDFEGTLIVIGWEASPHASRQVVV